MAEEIDVGTIKVGGLAELKAQLRDIKSEMLSATDPERMQQLAQAAGELKDKIGDANEQIKVFSTGSKFESVSNAFGSMKDSLMSLDFEEAADKAKTFSSAVTSIDATTITNGIKGLTSVVFTLGKTFVQFGVMLLTNPIFLIAAAIVGIVAAIAMLLNAFGLLKPIIDAVKKAFDAVMWVVNTVIQGFKDLTDWLGLTTYAEEEYANKVVESGEKRRKALAEEGAEREKYAAMVEEMTDEDIRMIEKRTGIQIANEKSLWDIKGETLEKTRDQLNEEIDALQAIEEAGGELTDEQKKQLKERLDEVKKTNQAIKDNELAKTKAIIEFNRKTQTTLRDWQLKNITDEQEKNKKLLEISKQDELRKIDLEIKKAKQLGQNTKALEQTKVEIEKFFANESNKIDAEKRKEEASRQRQAVSDYQSAMGKQLKALQDRVKADIAVTEEGSKARLDAELKGLTTIEEFQKKNAKALQLTQDQLTVIYEENADKRVKLQADFDNKIVDSANKQKLLAAELQILEATTAEEKLNAQKVLLQTQRDINLENAKLSADERKKIEQQSVNDIAAIDKQLTDLKAAEEQKRIDNAKAAREIMKNYMAEGAAKDKEEEDIRFEEEKTKLTDALNNKVITQDQFDAAMVVAKERHSKAIDDIDKHYADEEKKRKQENADRALGIASTSLGAIASLSEAFAGKSVASQKKAFETQKKLNIAIATIDMIKGAVAAYNSAQSLPFPAGIIVGALSAAAVVAAGIANIKKISATKFEGGGGSTPSTPSTGNLDAAASTGGAATPTPSLFGNSQNLNTATGAKSVESKPQVVQAVVVESEITASQSKAKRMQESATL